MLRKPSSAEICRLTAEGVAPRSSAALVKLPTLLATSNTCSGLRGGTVRVTAIPRLRKTQRRLVAELPAGFKDRPRASACRDLPRREPGPDQSLRARKIVDQLEAFAPGGGV